MAGIRFRMIGAVVAIFAAIMVSACDPVDDVTEAATPTQAIPPVTATDAPTPTPKPTVPPLPAQIEVITLLREAITVGSDTRVDVETTFG